jgi:hypothetical protein
MTTPDAAAALVAAADVFLAARLVLARDAWDAALLAGDLEAADRLAAEVADLEARRP